MRTLSNRRHFLKQLGSGLTSVALAQAAPRAFRLARGNDAPRSLVVIQLHGGNDAFNTLVPFADDDYHRLRPTLARRRSEVLPLSETVALPREAGDLRPLFDEGLLRFIPDVTLPFSADSHHRANEMWHTASADELLPARGWLDQVRTALADRGEPCRARHGTTREPLILHRGLPTYAGSSDACTPLATAGLGLGPQLTEIAGHIAAGRTHEIHFVSFDGFDTHFDQATRHPARLGELSHELAQFQRRLARDGTSERVATFVFSEFGRSLAENRQGGTDHANASLALLVSSAVRGGIFSTGQTGSRDFRTLCHDVANEWFGASESVATRPASKFPPQFNV